MELIKLLVIVGIFVVIYFINKEAEDAKFRKAKVSRGNSWRKHREFEAEGDIKFFEYFDNDDYVVVVDNFLHTYLRGNKRKINISNVMATEIKYHVSERNQMRFMSIMPTFDKHTKLVKIELILYRRDKCDANIKLNPNMIGDQEVKKLKMILDEIIEEEKLSDKSE